MNKLYIDQIMRSMNTYKTQIKGEYDDRAMAQGAMSWFVKKLEQELAYCVNVEDSKCYTWWRHEQCHSLMALLFDLTNDPKYIAKQTMPNSWD